MPRFYPLPSVWRNVQMNEERIVGDAAWHNLVLTGPNRRVCTPCPNTPTPACRFTRVDKLDTLELKLGNTDSTRPSTRTD
jgi:hypothetical protein